MKDQVYDGQTQCTEQTLVSFASIRAENTVSALGDSNFNMHLLISSKLLNAYKLLNTNIHNYFNRTLTHNKTNTCYNLFLSQHNLPLLTENEILGSLLIHLSNHSFSQLILISINQTLTETHIYLNLNEPILKNHQILELTQFLNYYHLPI